MCKTKISYSTFVAMFVLCGASMFVGCGDDNSASVTDTQTEAISSSGEGQNTESSSSLKNSSSSAEKKSSSSSKEQIESSSSSAAKPLEESSSSEPESSGSSSSFDSSSSGDSITSNSSSSYVDPFEEPFDFDWTIPREALLNPEIEYDSIVDERDGQVYKTVKIGDKMWMAQNLNYADSVKTPSLVGRNWCYDNDETHCDLMGRLYTWAAAIDSVKLANDKDNPQQCGYYTTCNIPAVVQGICPDGWRLPSANEFKQLVALVDGVESYNWQNAAGRKLMSKTGWVCEDRGAFLCEEDWKGLDAVGFSAQPSGYHSFGNFFRNAGVSTGLWSSTEFYKEEAFHATLEVHGDANAQVVSTGKRFGFSVRCVKD